MVAVLAALLASSAWTFASFIWRSQSNYFPPIDINYIKNIFAACIFIPILFTINWLDNWVYLGTLFLSGVLGIALGDTFYILSLQKMGTRKTLSVEAISPILAMLLGSIIMDDKIKYNSWLGAIIVAISLFFLVSQNYSGKQDRKSINIAIVYAFSSIICAIIGAMLSRIVLLNSSLNPIQTTEIRLIAAIVVLFPFAKVGFVDQIKIMSKATLQKLVAATLLGTNLGIVFQQVVFKMLPVGLGWTLLSTSTLFSLYVARLEGESLNKLSIFYSITTFLGVLIALN